MLEAALRLAQTGVAVFPVSSETKAPRTPRGFYDATTDEAQIRAWDWTDCMIGSPPPEGVIVIDIDPRNGGEMTMALFPALPPTRTTRTRSGGRHCWLTVSSDQKLRGVLGRGVDVKRAGKGYVVIPPSPGYVYVRGGPMAPAPDWLMEELVMPEFDPDAAAAPKFFPFQVGTPYGEAALRNALRRLAEAENGSRNDELNKAAFGLAQLEAGGELSRDAALEGLLRVSEEIGLSDWEARNTIESGWTAGAQRPRQAPARTGAGESTDGVDDGADEEARGLRHQNPAPKTTTRWCHHENVSERPRYAIDDEPGHYLCLDCGSKFPLIGDTSKWAARRVR